MVKREGLEYGNTGKSDNATSNKSLWQQNTNGNGNRRNGRTYQRNMQAVSLFWTKEAAEEFAVTKTNDIYFYVVVPCVLLDEEFAKWREEECTKAMEKCNEYFDLLMMKGV